MTKFLTVASNGQISIGKEWAGKQILIQTVSSNELRILSGSFIPDKDLTFHTSEAKEALEDFENWAQKNPPKKTKREQLMTQLEKKIREKTKG